MRSLRLRMLLVTAMAVAVAGFMLVSGHRDLTLLLGKETTAGRIVKVHQPPPGRVRESDYQVWYEFLDNTGVARSGEDVLPPAHAPAADGRINIAYSPRNPSVSRIASQVSSTPLRGLLLALACLGWVTAQLIRQGRSKDGGQRAEQPGNAADQAGQAARSGTGRARDTASRSVSP